MAMIPYAADVPFDRRPIANWLIFGTLILVFLIQCKVGFVADAGAKAAGFWDRLVLIFLLGRKVSGGYVERLLLHRWGILGIFVHNWLHPNSFQLMVNLLFLWPLGNAVCSKIGSKNYLRIFLGFCLVGGIIHLLISGRPAAGPSVAICAVAGMYLVFFPENPVSCFFIFPRPIR